MKLGWDFDNNFKSYLDGSSKHTCGTETGKEGIEDMLETTAMTHKTFDTFASGCSGCTNVSLEKVIQKFRLNNSGHKDMLALLEAVTEIIKVEDEKKTETEYFAALMTTLDQILHNILVLMSSASREVAGAALRFVKVFIASTPILNSTKYVANIVKALVEMSEDCKRHFRGETKNLLERLVRKFGWDYVSSLVPKSEMEMHRRLKNMRKELARKARKVSADSGADEEDFVTKNRHKTTEKILADSSDGEDELLGEEPASIKGKGKKKKTSQTCLQESGEGIVDLLSPIADQAVSSTFPKTTKSDAEISKKSNTGFKLNSDGKLVIDGEDSDDEQPKKRRLMTRLDSDSDEETFDPLVSTKKRKSPGINVKKTSIKDPTKIKAAAEVLEIFLINPKAVLSTVVLDFFKECDADLASQFVAEKVGVQEDIKISLADIVQGYQGIKDCWSKDENKDWGSLVNNLVFSYLISEATNTAEMFQKKMVVEQVEVGFTLLEFVKFYLRRICRVTEPDLVQPAPATKQRLVRSKYFKKSLSTRNNVPRIGLTCKPKWIPPKSPFDLIQEKLYPHPWKLLVATIFLNKTNNKVSLPILSKFFSLWPSPQSASLADPDQVADLLQPMGLHNLRAKTLIKFSWEFVNNDWRYPIELFGIGKYGNDSYRIFCVEEWREVQPRDKKLNIYHEWISEKYSKV